MTGFVITLIITVLSIVAMRLDLHDMQSQIKHNTDDIEDMNELIHGRR